MLQTLELKCIRLVTLSRLLLCISIGQGRYHSDQQEVYRCPIVSYVIMPVCALANAGVVIQGNLCHIQSQPISYSILVALWWTTF